MDTSATLPNRAPSSTRGGSRRALVAAVWSLVLGLSLYYIVQNAVPYFTSGAAYYRDHATHPGWLLLHVAGGMTALLVGPLQFSSAVRRRYLTVHRWTGRIYLVSVAVSVISAIRILLLPHSSFGFRIGIAGLALAWITTTGLAYAAVLNKQMVLHKEWMIRSYVVTFGFVFFRLMLNPLFALGIATRPEIVSAVSWMCWAVPLLMTEFILSARKIVQARQPAGVPRA